MNENEYTDLDLNEDVESQDQPIIKVIGVGGCGGNAVNYMYNMGIKDVNFVVCNTDKQDLRKSPVPTKIQLGEKGLGAGCIPEVGYQEAQKSIDKIQAMLDDNTEMVFIAAGMGGGTGTGAAPLIAKTAKEKGILTVAIVTIPSNFEGDEKVRQALLGVEEMKKNVDAILVINSQKILDMYGDLFLDDAYAKGDEILATAAKGIAEIITLSGRMNIDMADVRTVMTDSGDAIMGAAKASGPDRAIEAIQKALESPLLVSTNLSGAKNILLNITHGKEKKITTSEVTIIRDHLQKQIDGSTRIIWGVMLDESLEDNLGVTIVATGFDFTGTSTKAAQPAAAPAYPNNAAQPAQAAQPQQPNPYDVYYKNSNNNSRETAQQANQYASTPRVALDMSDDEYNTPTYARGGMAYDTQVKPTQTSTLDMDEQNGGLNSRNRFLHNNVD